jgi:hypothetical protein
MSPLTPEESSSDSAISTFDSYGTEQSASDTNLPTQFVQLAPHAQLRRVKVVDRFNSIKVHTDLIMSMLTDKRLSVDQFKLYEMIVKLLSEHIAGKEVVCKWSRES